MLFSTAFGIFLELGDVLPYKQLLQYSFYPYLAAIPVLALQLWIATVSQNQGIPITTGILGVIFAYSADILPDWFIWKWPSLINAWDEPLVNVGLGVSVGALLYVVGMLDFFRRDVK